MVEIIQMSVKFDVPHFSVSPTVLELRRHMEITNVVEIDLQRLEVIFFPFSVTFYWGQMTWRVIIG